jgi:hypothetical protein
MRRLAITSFMLSAPTLCSTAKVQVTTDRKGRDDLANQGGKPMAETDQQPAAAPEWLNLDAATPPAIRNRRAKPSSSHDAAATARSSSAPSVRWSVEVDVPAARPQRS